MESIESKNGGIKWVVTDVDDEGICSVECPECKFSLEYHKSKIESFETCPNCQPEPAALKTDGDGNCITICEIGMVEYIRDYMEKHEATERAAVRAFLEAVKAHLPDDDPELDGLTEESVRADVRRQTGKKKIPDSSGADCPNNKTKRYSIAATPESIKRFLSKYLPDYVLIPKLEAAQYQTESG